MAIARKDTGKQLRCPYNRSKGYDVRPNRIFSGLNRLTELPAGNCGWQLISWPHTRCLFNLSFNDPSRSRRGYRQAALKLLFRANKSTRWSRNLFRFSSYALFIFIIIVVIILLFHYLSLLLILSYHLIVTSFRYLGSLHSVNHSKLTKYNAESIKGIINLISN